MSDPEKTETKKEEKADVPLPSVVYLTTRGQANLEHRGRSEFGRKINGYKIQKGQYTAVNHPQDVEFYVSLPAHHTIVVLKTKPKKGSGPIVLQLADADVIKKYQRDNRVRNATAKRAQKEMDLKKAEQDLLAEKDAALKEIIVEEA